MLTTGPAGIPLVIELFRQISVAHTIDADVIVKRRRQGLLRSQVVESQIVL